MLVSVAVLTALVTCVHGRSWSGCEGHSTCLFKDAGGGFGVSESPTVPTVYNKINYQFTIQGETDCDKAAAYWRVTVICDDKTDSYDYTQNNDGDAINQDVPGAYNCRSNFRVETWNINGEHNYAGCALDFGTMAGSYVSTDMAGNVLHSGGAQARKTQNTLAKKPLEGPVNMESAAVSGWAFQPPCHEPGYPDHPPRGHQGHCTGDWMHNITMYDYLRVPENLKPGDYVLGFRYDCESTAQVWQSCADVKITAPSSKAGLVV